MKKVIAGGLATLLLSVAPLVQGADLPTYEVVARDGRLLPDTLKIPAGQRFKIVIKNQGNDAIEFESNDLRKEKVLAPGAHSFVVIPPLKPGTYRFFDEFHSATGQGRIVAE